MYRVVADIEAARADLAAHGAEVSEVFRPAAPGAEFSVMPGPSWMEHGEPGGVYGLDGKVDLRAVAGRVAPVMPRVVALVGLLRPQITATTRG